MSSERLNQIAAEMRGLCAELEKADGVVSEEQRAKALDLCSDLDTEFGVPAFRPEVPEATREMFFRLANMEV